MRTPTLHAVCGLSTVVPESSCVACSTERERRVREVAPALLVALKELASASEEFATADMDMPSFADTEKRFDRALMAGLDAIAKAEGR